MKLAKFFVLFTLLASETNAATSLLESANEKADSGRANELTLDEASALRTSRENRQAKYKETLDRKVEEKLAQFPTDEVKAYWVMRREMDAYAESHEDFPPEKQDAMFSKFSQDLRKPVDELKALYLKLDAKTVITSEDGENSKVVEKTDKIDVSIDVQATKNGQGDIRVSGRTNLPESTKITMSIQLVKMLGSLNSLRQGEISVTNGNIRSDWCQKLENGVYRIRLRTSGAQPDSVNSILGSNGQNLIGKYVVHPDYLRDGIYIIDKSTFFTLGLDPTSEAPNPTIDASDKR